VTRGQSATYLLLFDRVRTEGTLPRPSRLRPGAPIARRTGARQRAFQRERGARRRGGRGLSGLDAGRDGGWRPALSSRAHGGRANDRDFPAAGGVAGATPFFLA